MKFPVLDEENESYILRKHPNRIELTTWFGLEFSQSGMTVKIRLPEGYGNFTEGLCADGNGDPTDDYRLRNGTVLPYDQPDGFGRSDSEYKCAQDQVLSSLCRITVRL